LAVAWGKALRPSMLSPASEAIVIGACAGVEGVDLRVPGAVVDGGVVEQDQGRGRVGAAGPVVDRGVGSDQLALVHGFHLQIECIG